MTKIVQNVSDVMQFIKKIISLFSPRKRKEAAIARREKHYQAMLTLCEQQTVTLNDIVCFGDKLMRRAHLHPHFFGQNSLRDTALALAYFALQLPAPGDKPDPQYLSKKINPTEAQKIFTLFEQRIAKRLPVAYITHETWYWGHQFHVNEHVLVPRSIMNTRFADFLNFMQWENKQVLDLCTGSGCIGITLALMDESLQVDLVDISEKALEVAQINVNRYALQSRVHCIQSNLFEQVHKKYDLIITNPPYVSIAEYNASPEEFKNEPKIALESGKDGLTLIHQILEQAKNYLTPNGKLIAEVGFTAAKRLKKKYPSIPFTWFKYRRPNGKESWLGMHGIFLCQAKDLPTPKP